MFRTRRSLLLMGILAPVGAAFAYHWPRRGNRLKGAIRSMFGVAIANHPETQQFIKDVLDAGKEDEDMSKLTDLFARSTNVVISEETGEEFLYLGLFDPYDQPCANPLSSHWL